MLHAVIAAVISAELQTGVLISVKYTHLNDIVVASQNHAIVAGIADGDTVHMPVAALQGDTTLAKGLLGEI